MRVTRYELSTRHEHGADPWALHDHSIRLEADIADGATITDSYTGRPMKIRTVRLTRMVDRQLLMVIGPAIRVDGSIGTADRYHSARLGVDDIPEPLQPLVEEMMHRVDRVGYPAADAISAILRPSE